MKTDFALKDVDPEDIEELLMQIEKSFGIEFLENELTHIECFGVLCDHIADKMNCQPDDGCTSQQAFYKFRHAICSSIPLDSATITPDILLEDIIPRKERRKTLSRIEMHLGFKLSILKPSTAITTLLVVLALLSIVGFLFYWQIGFLGILVAIGGFRLANFTAREFQFKTVGAVVEKMEREHYRASRRFSNTFNRKEIEKILRAWFAEYLGLEKAVLTREAEF